MTTRVSLPLQSDSSSDSDNDDEEQYGGVDQLVINERFARRFEEKGRFNELQRNKELLLRGELDEEDSESDESEDDDAELLSNVLEINIIKTINSIRKKDPSVYDPKVTWFDDGNSNNDGGNDDDDDGSHKKKRFKDVLREQLLSAGADIDDPDSATTSNRFDKRRANIMYDREQESLREDILKSIHKDDDSDDYDNDNQDDSSDDSGGNILVVKKKSGKEKAQEKAELERALSEMKKLSKGKDEEADSFLTDYISNKKWKQKTVINSKNADIGFSDDDDDEKDEEELDMMEAFESKYNFRFEELQDNPGASNANFMYGSTDLQVVGHARSVEGSVRRLDTKRKEEREKHREKKEKEKRVKIEELKRLKNLKRQELVERLKRISKVGGVALESEEGLGAIDVDALDEDWSPEKHEEMMRRQFSDEYYAMEEEEDLAIGAEMDDLNQILGGAGYDDEEENEGAYDKGGKQSMSAMLKKRQKEKKKKGKKGSGGGSDSWIDEDDIMSNTLYDKEQAASMLEELYKLDYEDVVAGIPCRFKYKQVVPQSFGLTADDILEADDAELNNYVSLKKVSAYYNKPFDDSKASKKRKKLRQAIREKLDASEGTHTVPASEDADEAAEAVQTIKRKRKKAKSGKKEVEKDALKARLSLYK